MWGKQYLRTMQVALVPPGPSSAAGGDSGSGSGTALLRGCRMLKDVTQVGLVFDLFCRLSRLSSPQGVTSRRFLAQDGTRCPCSPQVSPGLIIQVAASEEALLNAIDSMFVVASASGTTTTTALSPSLWCKLRDVMLVEQDKAAAGSGREDLKGGEGPVKEVVGVMKSTSDCKSSLVSLPVCHSQVSKP